MRSRSQLWKNAAKPPPPFGKVGTRLVKYEGDLPYQFRGPVTSTLYVWTRKHPVHAVDKRDLPALAKAAGRGNLSSPQGPLGGEEEPEAEPELEEVGDYDGDHDGGGPDA